MNQIKKTTLALLLPVILALGGCAASGTPETTAVSESAPGGQDTIVIAAAASLEKCLEEQLIPLFEEKNKGIVVEGTYDSSGKLQTQIEEGADVDLFFSAASKQMDALTEQGLMQENTVTGLLENNIVLIVPAGQEEGFQAFEDIVKAEHVAVGDPESVPAGQYAKDALTSLGLWDQVLSAASLGTNVTEVLNWVAEGSAEAGIVYATDAAQTDQVTVIGNAPKGSVQKVVYPVGILKASTHQGSAKAFLEFLKSEEAMQVFEENGFSAASGQQP